MRKFDIKIFKELFEHVVALEKDSSANIFNMGNPTLSSEEIDLQLSACNKYNDAYIAGREILNDKQIKLIICRYANSDNYDNIIEVLLGNKNLTESQRNLLILA